MAASLPSPMRSSKRAGEMATTPSPHVRAAMLRQPHPVEPAGHGAGALALAVLFALAVVSRS
jgi:MYXO-CTERM domain-containing protein